MKIFVTIVLISLSSFYSFSQNPLKLSIVKGAELPNSEPINYYLLEISNPTQGEAQIIISAVNQTCTNTRMEVVRLNQEVLDKQKNRKLNLITLAAGESVEFYLKLSRPLNTRANTWNCTEIKAVTENGSQYSNAITIESLIPNSNNAE
jgi:uncharacterized membrane protein